MKKIAKMVMFNGLLESYEIFIQTISSEVLGMGISREGVVGMQTYMIQALVVVAQSQTIS